MDLDRPETLDVPEVDAVLHCAPPPPSGDRDTRTASLLAALRRPPARIVYISTSGVYGECGGEKVDEATAPNPQTPRARRRHDAETQLTRYASNVVILRAPAIYASDRLPLERLRAGTPVLRAEEDVYTNHIHADDLAAIAVRALEDDSPPGVYNIADDTEMHMGDWMDLVARHAGLPAPPRRSRAEIAREVPAILLSFMSESRRLDNHRMKAVLGARLRYPTVHEGLAHEPHTLGID
jgi:nucleoside-diphosphate-sugar epimerase